MSMMPRDFGLSHMFYQNNDHKIDNRCATISVAHLTQGNLAMKRPLVLLFLLFLIFLFEIPCQDKIIRITIVIPQEYMPYYDRVIDFPGWQPVPEESVPIKTRTEYCDSSLCL
jgi:hypothetical protein